MTTTDGLSPGVHPSSPPTKASLASWWERFKKKPTHKEEGRASLSYHSLTSINKTSHLQFLGLTLIILVERPTGIFSVPLHKSIQYANVAISLTDANGEQFIYGYVPIVVAKCGVFLKEKGLFDQNLS